MNSDTSTRWPGPVGEAWDAAHQALVEFPWEAWAQRAMEYTSWALTALAEVTAYANELSDAQLAGLQADYERIVSNPARYGPYGRLHWFRPESRSWNMLRSFRQLHEGARQNLASLWSVGGYVVRGAGLATITQGIAPHDAVDVISGPWLRCGHPLPRTDLVVD